jgi:hypothetical protein
MGFGSQVSVASRVVGFDTAWYSTSAEAGGASSNGFPMSLKLNVWKC